MMLFHMYQIFSCLRGHLHFSVHFFLTFMANFFFNHPISQPNRLNTAGNTTGKESSKAMYGYDIYYRPVFRKQLAILSVS